MGENSRASSDEVSGEQLAPRLLQWFASHGRPLPWRLTYDPYHVWLSEVMLQQTQMERGVAYFRRWLERFPSVEAVAAASREEILKAWEGLGYYARARNLHQAAQVIVREHRGLVPCSYETLRSLPGIGPYTAAAIASIAGNEDVAAVDANVLRVYARLFDIDRPVGSGPGRRQVEELAARLLPPGRARLYNQALMDFGGLVCLPRLPRCASCPLSSLCRAAKAGTVAQRPLVKAKKKLVCLQRAAAVIVGPGGLILCQRPAGELWGGMWEFPGGEYGEEGAAEALPALIRRQTGQVVRVEREIVTVVHHYTHHRVQLTALLCAVVGDEALPGGEMGTACRRVPRDELHRYAFPAGTRKVLAHIEAVCPDLLLGR